MSGKTNLRLSGAIALAAACLLAHAARAIDVTVDVGADVHPFSPLIFGVANGGLPGPVLVTFLICFAAIAVLYVTLVRYELLSKSTTFRLRALERRAGGDDVLPRRSAVLQA